jgi:phosphate/sulfate permease
VPTEVVLACHIAMGFGTLFGGWRIVKTMEPSRKGQVQAARTGWRPLACS